MNDRYPATYADMPQPEGLFSLFDLHRAQPRALMHANELRAFRQEQIAWVSLDGLLIERKLRRGEAVLASDIYDEALQQLVDVDDSDLEAMIRVMGERIFNARLHQRLAQSALFTTINESNWNGWNL